MSDVVFLDAAASDVSPSSAEASLAVVAGGFCNLGKRSSNTLQKSTINGTLGARWRERISLAHQSRLAKSRLARLTSCLAAVPTTNVPNQASRSGCLPSGCA